MLLSQAVARDLPRLRRYARALTGSQASGDAYVTATLEALVEDSSALDVGEDVGVALYRVFSRIWNSIDQVAASSVDPTSPVDRHIEKISPLPRQAFLLVALEEFSEEDTATILDVPATEIPLLVAESARELAAEIATEVLIIEDEPLIAMDLESLVEGLGHKVVGIARTHAEAVSLALAKWPGLILADIRLADMSSGLEAVKEVLQSFEVPVVFITAYPERLLTGERPEPTFLITKPFRPSMVMAIVSQALFFEQRARLKDRSSSPAS